MSLQIVKDLREFQSSPAPKDGRYGSGASYLSMTVLVSILARPEGRALPLVPGQLLCAVEFQSSPAPKDGRYRIHRAPS